MAVLDVTIPTGYIIQQQKLDAYILTKNVRNLQRARFQERKVLFYFDYVSICFYYFIIQTRCLMSIDFYKSDFQTAHVVVRYINLMSL